MTENLESAKRKKTEQFIDIIYSEFDSVPDSDEDPEWLPPDSDSSSDSDSESQKFK